MKPDPLPQKLRETAWRRPLTPAEQTEWQTWLAAHPEAQAEAEMEAALDRVLHHRDTAPVSSNFTARVMQAIAADTRRAMQPIAPAHGWWRKLVPRLALAALILTASALTYRQYLVGRQKELAAAAAEVAQAQPLSNAAIIEDFDVIRSLMPSTAVADEKLLALSEELLALNP